MRPLRHRARHRRDPLRLLRPLLSLPPMPLGDGGSSRTAVAARTMEPARDPVRELLDRTDDRCLQNNRQLPRMPRTLQPPLRGSLAPLFH